MLHFSHSAPYCYRLQLVAWYPLLSISLQERKYTHHISHIDQVIECTRIARPRVCIPPSTHPASSKRTLYLVCVFYPFLFPFFVIIVVAIDKTNAKLLKQRVSDSGLDLPSQKRQDEQCALVPPRIIPLNWHAFTCILPSHQPICTLH